MTRAVREYEMNVEEFVNAYRPKHVQREPAFPPPPLEQLRIAMLCLCEEDWLIFASELRRKQVLRFVNDEQIIAFLKIWMERHRGNG